MSNKSLSNYQAKKLLITFFEKNGCVRVVDEKRRKELGQKYKKGYEVRLVASSEEELENIRQLLQQSGFNLGKPYLKRVQYKKRVQFVQPIYGKLAVDWFTSQAGKQP